MFVTVNQTLIPKMKPFSSAPPQKTALLLLLLLSTTAVTPALSLSFLQYKSLISLSHSLLIRVSNLRESRGDLIGARRAKLVADKLDQYLGLGFQRLAWSAGWDFVMNYGWNEWNYRELFGIASDLNKLMNYVTDLSRTSSIIDKAAWIAQSYDSVLRISSSTMNKLLIAFRKSGTLSEEALEMIQIEIIEGGLLKDCLEVGSMDLKGIIQIINDLALQFYYSSERK